MPEVRQTEIFARWRACATGEPKDASRPGSTVWKIGNPGDVRPVGSGVSEMRVDYGPGYRVYFVSRGNALVILLAGGDKRSQERDIATAIRLAREV